MTVKMKNLIKGESIPSLELSPRVETIYLIWKASCHKLVMWFISYTFGYAPQNSTIDRSDVYKRPHATGPSLSKDIYDFLLMSTDD